MNLRFVICVASRHLALVPVFAIMALTGCGLIAPTRAAEDGSGAVGDDQDAASSCPSFGDVNSGAAVGGACVSEGEFCTDLSCNPCDANCPAVSCSDGHWVTAMNTAICTGDASPVIEDAGPLSTDAAADAMICTNLDPSMFDQSCMQDTDCETVSAGTICNIGGCACPAGAINVSEDAAYTSYVQQIVATLQPTRGGCDCPAFGKPRCINNTCITCGAAATCPDGG